MSNMLVTLVFRLFIFAITGDGAVGGGGVAYLQTPVNVVWVEGPRPAVHRVGDGGVGGASLTFRPLWMWCGWRGHDRRYIGLETEGWGGVTYLQTPVDVVWMEGPRPAVHRVGDGAVGPSLDFYTAR